MALFCFFSLLFMSLIIGEQGSIQDTRRTTLYFWNEGGMCWLYNRKPSRNRPVYKSLQELIRALWVGRQRLISNCRPDYKIKKAILRQLRSCYTEDYQIILPLMHTTNIDFRFNFKNFSFGLLYDPQCTVCASFRFINPGDQCNGFFSCPTLIKIQIFQT